jgi:hypothetical protein
VDLAVEDFTKKETAVAALNQAAIGRERPLAPPEACISGYGLRREG